MWRCLLKLKPTKRAETHKRDKCVCPVEGNICLQRWERERFDCLTVFLFLLYYNQMCIALEMMNEFGENGSSYF